MTVSELATTTSCTTSGSRPVVRWRRGSKKTRKRRSGCPPVAPGTSGFTSGSIQDPNITLILPTRRHDQFWRGVYLFGINYTWHYDLEIKITSLWTPGSLHLNLLKGLEFVLNRHRCRVILVLRKLLAQAAFCTWPKFYYLHFQGNNFGKKSIKKLLVKIIIKEWLVSPNRHFLPQKKK